MNTEVIKADYKTELANPAGVSWGTEGVLSADLIIPKLLLMQGPSEYIQDEDIEAKLGEIRETIEARKVGSLKEPAKVIPFFFVNKWFIERFEAGQYIFDHIENRGVGEKPKEYDEEIDGKKYRNHRSTELYCLLADDLKEGTISPYCVLFKKTSYKKAARDLALIATRLKGAGKSLGDVVLDLSVTKEENDKGQWYAFNLAIAKDKDGKSMYTSAEESEIAREQYFQIKAAYQNNRLKTDAVEDSPHSTESVSSPDLY